MKNCVKVFFISLFFYNCATHEVDCPPKFTVYRNINKAYPVYAKNFNLELKNSLSTVDKINDTISIKFKTKITKLRDDLNNISSRVEILTKSNLLSYFSGICDPKVRENFFAFQNKLADLTMEVTKVEAKIAPTKGLNNNLDKKLDDALALTENLKTKIN